MPASAPDLRIPSSPSTVKVSIIDSTTFLAKLPGSLFFYPEIQGKAYLNGPSYVFLIEHDLRNGAPARKFLFDLAMRKDWQESRPASAENIKKGGWEVTIEKNVVEVLEDGGIKGDEIEGIILSHHHIDHIGDPSTFPSSTDLIVGPGWKKDLMPGAPTNPDSPLLESDYSGRTLREIDFQTPGKGQSKLGQYNAYDFFGDGSFYLLDTPGHAVGHMCGLARTTPDPNPTFILMGGDLAHHSGEFRPSQYIPLPDSISPNPLHPLTSNAPACPGHLFEQIHPAKTGAKPFFRVPTGEDGKPSIAHDAKAHQDSLDKLEDFDAWPDNVFVVIAHDNTLKDIVTFWPRGDANAWREKGWAERSRWGFLGDFKEAVEAQAEA